MQVRFFLCLKLQLVFKYFNMYTLGVVQVQHCFQKQMQIQQKSKKV